MADKILEYSPGLQQIQAVEKADPNTGLEQRIKNLEDKISQLTTQISSFQASRSRPRSRSYGGGRQQPGARSQSPNPNASEGRICRYHRRYGAKAYKCLLPCGFVSAAPTGNEKGN